MNSDFFAKFLNFLKNVWFLWLICLLVNIITFLLIIFKIHPGNGTLTLRYSVIAGAEIFGKGRNLYLIPAVGLMAIAANFYVFQKLKGENYLLSYLSAFISLSVQFILLAAIFFLMSVN